MGQRILSWIIANLYDNWLQLGNTWKNLVCVLFFNKILPFGFSCLFHVLISDVTFLSIPTWQIFYTLNNNTVLKKNGTKIERRHSGWHYAPQNWYFLSFFSITDILKVQKDLYFILNKYEANLLLLTLYLSLIFVSFTLFNAGNEIPTAVGFSYSLFFCFFLDPLSVHQLLDGVYTCPRRVRETDSESSYLHSGALP